MLNFNSIYHFGIDTTTQKLFLLLSIPALDLRDKTRAKHLVHMKSLLPVPENPMYTALSPNQTQLSSASISDRLMDDGQQITEDLLSSGTVIKSTHAHNTTSDIPEWTDCGGRACTFRADRR